VVCGIISMVFSWFSHKIILHQKTRVGFRLLSFFLGLNVTAPIKDEIIITTSFDFFRNTEVAAINIKPRILAAYFNI